MFIFNYLGSGLVCVIIYFLIASLKQSNKESLDTVIGRIIVLVILFIALLRT